VESAETVVCGVRSVNRRVKLLFSKNCEHN
jgi:hypothetical protein